MIRDMKQLDLNLLKALDALLTERHVTRAAARLGLTQPAVSGMLARLRDAFDDPLFVQTQRGIAPTPRALHMADPLRRMLEEIDALLTPPAFDPASARLTLSLAATDYAMQVVVVPFLERLRQLAPGIRVAVYPESHVAMHRFEQGDLDLALVATQSAPSGLHTRALFDETYVVAMREGHADAGSHDETALSLDRFCALDHALVSLAGGSFQGVTDQALAAIGRERHVALSVTSFLVLAQVLRGSDLIAVVPARLVRSVPGLAVRTPPLAIPGFSKAMVWHERTHRDPAHRWLRELLRQTDSPGIAP